MAHFFSWWSVSSSLALDAWRTLQKNQNQAKSYVGIVITHPRTVFAFLAGRSLFTIISLYTEQRHYTRAREFLLKTYSRSLWTVWTGRASLSWRARKSRRTNLSGHALLPRSTLNAINLRNDTFRLGSSPLQNCRVFRRCPFLLVYPRRPRNTRRQD